MIIRLQKGSCMKTILQFAITKPGGGISLVRKTMDLPFALHEGMTVGDYNWENGKKVTSVSFNIKEDPQDSYFYISLENENAQTAEEQQSLVDFFKESEWEEIC